MLDVPESKEFVNESKVAASHICVTASRDARGLRFRLRSLLCTHSPTTSGRIRSHRCGAGTGIHMGQRILGLAWRKLLLGARRLGAAAEARRDLGGPSLQAVPQRLS